MSLSAWCWTPDDIPSHESAHKVCEMRQKKSIKDGGIGPCSCTEYGGHELAIVGAECNNDRDKK